MKWEPQRFDDEPNTPPKPKAPHGPSLPFFPPPKTDYLAIIARVLNIIVNILIIIFILMLMSGIQVFEQSLEKKEVNEISWAADKQFKVDPNKNPKKLKDFLGYQDVKNELQKYVEAVNPNNPINPNLPRGILLHGPPGTGKTHLAKCLAGSVYQHAPFFITTGSDFVEKYVGVGASRVRSLFNTAKITAQNKGQKYFFIFIDEIDAVGQKRSNDENKNQEQTNTLTALLAEIDGFVSSDQTPQAILIAATNRMDMLDNALVREGRLGNHILLDLPDLESTKKLLQETIVVPQGNTLDFDTIAKVIHGVHFSPAKIMALANETKEVAKKNNTQNITAEYIYEAMERVLMGQEKTSNRNEEEIKRVAIHELGHAILAKTLGFDVHRVTTKARGKAGGYTIFFPHTDTKLPIKIDLIKQIIIALGGRAAEEIFYNKDNISLGCGNDLEKADNIATQMVVNYGMSLKDDMKGLSPLKNTIDDEAKNKINDIITESYKIAKKILEKYKNNEDSKSKWQELQNTLTDLSKGTLNQNNFGNIPAEQIKIENNNITVN
ncbi:AAA family ATPase [Candidatus Phytoplasma solani]|uniref:AAA family ATPase n=1 Tax=Candidatus Phytoplasma solani TaxID=69896 RepID=UPI00358EEB24